MLLLLTIVHISVALLLILFVLIQDSKGDGVFGMGGGGGGSNQVLSTTGAANFLVKATRGLAIVFAMTSIGLTYLTSKHTGSVVDDYAPPKAAGAQNAGGAAAGKTDAKDQNKPVTPMPKPALPELPGGDE